jgi:hypothetical protein
MGPFNEMTQLKRRHSVLQLLKRTDLSEWSRNYWGTVYDTIAMTEGRYNARVVQTFKNIQPQPKGYISYE